MHISPRSWWRVLMVSLIAAAFVLTAAPDASAAKKKKAKAAATKPAKAAPAKAAEPVKAAEPAKPAEPAKAAEPAKPAAPKLDVTDVWNAECKKCHGADGKGKPPKTEDMSTAAWQKRFTDAQIRKAIADGFEREKDGATQKMKPLANSTPAKLDGLVAYVRGLAK